MTLRKAEYNGFGRIRGTRAPNSIKGLSLAALLAPFHNTQNRSRREIWLLWCCKTNERR
jgi:hypothetical protein